MNELTPDTPMEQSIDQSLGPTRPLYLVLDGERVTDVSFDDTGHLYQEVPEEHDLDYWREFLELKTSLLTYVDGLLISKPKPVPQDGHGVTEEEVEARIKEALDGQREEFMSILDGYSKKRTTKPK
jgi:hypothetical protein|nr:MAG TPA: hypothetical protein [Caudoviricetes sp.]